MQVIDKQNIIKTKQENRSNKAPVLVINNLVNRSSKKSVAIWAKLLTSFLICYFIFDRLLYKPELIKTYQIIWDEFLNSKNWAFVTLILVLTPINWGLEAKKWHILIQKIEPTTFLESYQAVLCGISLNILTPFGIGDIFGRMYLLKSYKRLQAIGSLLINRIAQLLPTLVFGMLAVGFVLVQYDTDVNSILYTTLLLVLASVCFFISKNRVFLFLQNKIKSGYISMFISLKNTQRTQILIVVIISIIRYGVFTIQFLLALLIFQVDLPIHTLLMGISWIFLMKTIVPSLSIFTDLATREVSALFFFGLWEVGLAQITAATMLIWLINIIIPAITGILFISKIQPLKSRSSLTKSKEA